jgi:tetratricopeptide (TPR) repeat protein
LNPLYFLTEKGYLQGEMGNFTDSIATYKRYFDIEGSRPGTDEMYYWLAMYLFADDPQGALETIKTYQDQVEVNEDDVFSYKANLAYIALRAEDLAFAEELLTSAAEGEPDSARVKYMQALLASANGDYATAVTLLSEVSTADENEYYNPYLNPDFGHDVMLDLAKAYAGAGQNDEARATFDTVVTDNPYWVQVYVDRAEFLIAIGDTEAARADLQTAFDMTDDPTLKAEIRDKLVELGN